MPCMWASSPARAGLLSLPPHLRVCAGQQALQCRSFSASAPARMSLTDLAVAPPAFLLDSIHSLGVPWCAVFPTSALLVRGLLVYYLSARPGRRSALIQSHLVPLASARTLWKSNTPQEIERRRRLAPPLRRLSYVLDTLWSRNVELHRLGKRFGAPRFHPRGLLNFGVLIAMTEAIRTKCGSREGLLPVVLSPFEWVARKVGLVAGAGDEAVEGLNTAATGVQTAGRAATASTAPTTTAADQASTLAQHGERMGTDGATALPSPQGAATPQASEVASEALQPGLSITTDTWQPPARYFDPSVQTEGFSWCLDLTQPDPTLILPLAVSTTFAFNIIYRPTVTNKAQENSTTPSPTPSESTARPDDQAAPFLEQKPSLLARLGIPPLTNLQRIQLTFGILFTFAAMKMPAAVLLYFVPSLLVSFVQRRWLDLKFPVKPPIQPCRRPLRYRVRREWVD